MLSYVARISKVIGRNHMFKHKCYTFLYFANCGIEKIYFFSYFICFRKYYLYAVVENIIFMLWSSGRVEGSLAKETRSLFKAWSGKEVLEYGYRRQLCLVMITHQHSSKRFKLVKNDFFLFV